MGDAMPGPVKTARYAAVMEEADAGGFGVWLPDFPGCTAHAADPLGAFDAARRALTRHILSLAEDGRPIPQPTPAEAVELPQDVPCHVFLIEVDIPDAKPVYVRLNVTLPAGLVRRIDAVAGGNRSGWLAMAADEQLKRYTAITSYAASVFASPGKPR
jgi:predicted RNase H-like HicB family nuclease